MYYTVNILNRISTFELMQPTRRQFLITGTGFIICNSLLSGSALSQQKKSTRIVLLGTKGGPRVGEAGRSNPATLILINDVPYLVDCGYGVSKQLITCGVALNRLRYVFITHHHSDHNLELGPLFYNAWITGLPVRVDAYGPPGLANMLKSSAVLMQRVHPIHKEPPKAKAKSASLGCFW